MKTALSLHENHSLTFSLSLSAKIRANRMIFYLAFHTIQRVKSALSIFIIMNLLIGDDRREHLCVPKVGFAWNECDHQWQQVNFAQVTMCVWQTLSRSRLSCDLSAECSLTEFQSVEIGIDRSMPVDIHWLAFEWKLFFHFHYLTVLS